MAVHSPFEIVDKHGGQPQTKDCDKAREFEPHPEHNWERKPGFPFKCEGIPEVEDQPTCLIYVSPEQPACGQIAPAKIRIKTRTVDARIPACKFHKKRYDSQSALARAQRDAQQPKAS